MALLTPSAPCSGVVALVAGHQDDGEAEHQGFDDAAVDIQGHDTPDHAGEIGAGADPQKDHAHEIAAQDTHHVEDGGEQRHRDDPGQQFGHHHILKGIDGHGVQGVQLLGDPHDADLGGDCGPGPGRDHDAGEHRSHLPDQAQGYRRTQGSFGTILLQGVVALEGHDHARKGAGEHNDQGGFDPDLINFLEEAAGPEGRHQGQAQTLQEEDHHAPGFNDDIQRPLSQPTDEHDHMPSR